MTDRYRSSLVEIEGANVAFVEFEIRRTIAVTPENYDQSIELMANLGISPEDRDFLRSGIKTGDKNTRRFYRTPWTESPAVKIDLNNLAALAKLVAGDNFFRVDGDPATGLSGVFTFAGKDMRVDLSTIELNQQFQARMTNLIDKGIDEAVKRGEISKQQGDVAKEICKQGRGSSVGCESLLREFARAKAERDQRERERQMRDVERGGHDATDRGNRERGNLNDGFVREHIGRTA